MNGVFEKALEIAVHAHKGQVDKVGRTYILHPLGVASRVDTLELKTVAILHDVIEDTSVTTSFLLEQGIPERIVEAVDALSKRLGEEYEDYLLRVKANPLAKEVKLADLADNTDPKRLGGLNSARRKRYAFAKDFLSK